MAYLMDANTFIQAKRLYYAIDFCPAFWDWLVKANAAKTVFSIDKVGDEIQDGNDALATWASTRGKEFFLPTDKAVLPSMPKVSEWVQSQKYRAAAVNEFLQEADYYLVAHAHARGLVVVTHEVPGDGVKRVKIPEVCAGLDIQFTNPFTMLRKEGARFVLG
jgi:hypothetical protein